jgi:alpha-beta hydrolase superfamily lysophospholipase
MKSSPLPAKQPSSRIKKIIGLTTLTVAVVVVAAYLLGPRNQLGSATPTPRPLPPSNITQLDNWVQTSESAFPDIRPNNAKKIVWYGGKKKKTSWSVVYIHGFSASHLETAPLTDLVAKNLGANAFHTRLTGHGRTGAAMAEATPQDWMADAVEAIKIGQTLGDKVLVISCSTGSTLATWFGTTPEAKQVAAHVFLSPNFGPKDKNAEITNAPWGKQIVSMILGPTRSWEPDNEGIANAWTTSYPTQSVFPMMALVKGVRDSDLSRFDTPLLLMYSEKDTVVDPEEIKSAFQRFGSGIKQLEAVTSEDNGQHLLVGDLRSPGTTAQTVDRVVQWVRTLP